MLLSGKSSGYFSPGISPAIISPINKNQLYFLSPNTILVLRCEGRKSLALQKLEVANLSGILMFRLQNLTINHKKKEGVGNKETQVSCESFYR